MGQGDNAERHMGVTEMMTKSRTKRTCILFVAALVAVLCMGMVLVPAVQPAAAAPAPSPAAAEAQAAALGTWEPSATAGFGTGSGPFIAVPFAEYEGELYTGVAHGDGAQVRVLRGDSWQVVNKPGFGDPDNDIILSLEVYGGRLYAGTFNFSSGCEIWSYNGTKWRQEVGQDPAGTPGTGNGFGNAGNRAAASMEVHGSKLYVGTVNLQYNVLFPPYVWSDGGEVWSFDGSGWSRSMGGGFGSTLNLGVASLQSYGGDLYAGTVRAEISVSLEDTIVNMAFNGKGCQLWRDGSGGWTKMGGNGFGDPENAALTSMEVYGGELMLGTFNGRLTLSISILTMQLMGLDWHSNNLGIYSCDGVSVSPVVKGGFPGIGGIGAFDMLAMTEDGKDLLLVASALKVERPGYEIDVHGLLVVYDGQEWRRAAPDGFGNPDNQMNVSLAAWEGVAYVGTSNSEGGCEIWRGIPVPPPPGSPAFYFAEGYTGAGFQEYLCLGNPGTAPVQVKVTYLFRDGATPMVRDYLVPAQSRLTVNVNKVVGEEKEVSIKCESDDPFISERPMYFDYTGAGESWTGGHDAVGASAPAKEWYFAEGYTGAGFDEYICVLNPGDSAAELTFRFHTQWAGEKVITGLTVPANSRETFLADDLLGGDYETSLKLESSVPVVAERPMYFDYLGAEAAAPRHWTGGHCVMGATGLATEYFFAEGTTRSGFEQYLTIQNPHDAAITVSASYQVGEGQGDPVQASYEVPARARRTVFVNAPEVMGQGKDVSVRLSCASEFLAERPMYFDYMGTGYWHWTGGHCVIGATGVGTSWFFAEGYTGDGFEEWLCIQNPGEIPAEVTITYYPEGGGEPIVRAQPLVGANTRYTTYVNFNAGLGLSLSAEVSSSQPVVVERPMYFDFFGWTGGHCVVGFTP